MNLDKEKQMEELCEEVDVILSVKDSISNEEIDNFLETFNLISESELREKLTTITGDKNYINNNKSGNNHNRENEIAKPEDEEVVKIVEKDSSEGVYSNIENDALKNIDMNMQTSMEVKYPSEIINDSIEDDDLNNIEGLSVIRGECKYGQLSIEWDWPINATKVMVCYRFDRFPQDPKDNSNFKVIISREKLEQKGYYTIDRALEGDYYFSVFVLKECKGKKYFSEGQRRLVTNRKPVDVYYELKINRSLFGKIKSVQIIFATDEDSVELPQIVAVAKNGNIPIMKAEGEVISTIDYQTLEKNQNSCIDLPLENIKRNMYVKLFFLDDSNNKIYRIVSPTKENLYIR